MDDYYALLGIEADATVDDIRGAYRSRKDDLDTGSESGRADAVKLNKAWNVLSDPYQRGRYDEQRAAAEAAGTLGDADGAGAGSGSNGSGARTPARNSRQERQQSLRDARAAKMQSAATISPPEGYRWPAQKQRVIAMVIDLIVLVVIFIGFSQFGAQAVAKSQKPEVVHLINQKDDQITALNKQKSDVDKSLSAAKKANNTTQQASLQKQSDDLKKQITDTTKARDDEFAKLNAYFLGGLLIGFGVGFLYLAVPSALSGRTLGKRMQHLVTLREDGSPLGARGAIVRYGSVVLATLVLYLLLRQIAGVVVLFGVTMWMRNPNMQGIHDRLAHTIVVSDATD
jgi:curved DNA-binding protein CbpA